MLLVVVWYCVAVMCDLAGNRYSQCGVAKFLWVLMSSFEIPSVFPYCLLCWSAGRIGIVELYCKHVCKQVSKHEFKCICV